MLAKFGLTISLAVEFTLEFKEIEKRVKGRRVHKASGRLYNTITKPPKVEGKDDVSVG